MEIAKSLQDTRLFETQVSRGWRVFAEPRPGRMGSMRRAGNRSRAWRKQQGNACRTWTRSRRGQYRRSQNWLSLRWKLFSRNKRICRDRGRLFSQMNRSTFRFCHLGMRPLFDRNITPHGIGHVLGTRRNHRTIRKWFRRERRTITRCYDDLRSTLRGWF